MMICVFFSISSDQVRVQNALETEFSRCLFAKKYYLNAPSYGCSPT